MDPKNDPVEFALPALMSQFGVPGHGAITSLADALDIKRQNASNLLKGKLKSIRYSHIAGVCRWLLSEVTDPIKRKELRQILPGALFQYTGPWNRILRASAATMILGERFWESKKKEVGWISGADAAVAAELIHALTIGGAQFQLNWINLPRHSARDEQHEDRSAATETFQAVVAERDQTTFLLGSQRVLVIQDDLVGDIWKIEAHRAPRVHEAPSIYMMYREEEAGMPESCFGSCDPPPGLEVRESPTRPGLYFRQGKEWIVAPSDRSGYHTGVVMIREDPRLNNVVVGLFGYSASCTMQIGRYFCEQPHEFQLYAGTEIRRAAYVVRISGKNRQALRLSIPGMGDAKA